VSYPQKTPAEIPMVRKLAGNLNFDKRDLSGDMQNQSVKDLTKKLGEKNRLRTDSGLTGKKSIARDERG